MSRPTKDDPGFDRRELTLTMEALLAGLLPRVAEQTAAGFAKEIQRVYINTLEGISTTPITPPRWNREEETAASFGTFKDYQLYDRHHYRGVRMAVRVNAPVPPKITVQLDLHRQFEARAIDTLLAAQAKCLNEVVPVLPVLRQLYQGRLTKTGQLLSRSARLGLVDALRGYMHNLPDEQDAQLDPSLQFPAENQLRELVAAGTVLRRNSAMGDTIECRTVPDVPWPQEWRHVPALSFAYTFDINQNADPGAFWRYFDWLTNH